MLIRLAITLMIFYTLSSICVSAQTSAFTYQGRLTDNRTPPTDTYDMEFRLFDALEGGNQLPQPTPITIRFCCEAGGVPVANGVFTVQLNFGGAAAFDGKLRWLQIAVKKPTDTSFVTLSPRQAITSTPYALRTFAATSADALSSACTLCVTDTQIQAIDGNKVTGTVANASNATSAVNVSGVVQIANGGTGSPTKNFVDISSDQIIDGLKSITNLYVGDTFQLNPMPLPGCSMNDVGRVVYIFPNDVGQLAVCAHTPLGFPLWRFLQESSLLTTAPTPLRTPPTHITQTEDHQLQIEHLRDSIRKQESQIAALKKLVCADHPGEALCKD